MDKKSILSMVKGTKWNVSRIQDNIKMVQVSVPGTKINVYWGTSTVMVQHGHGKQEVTKYVTLGQLENMLGLRSWFSKFLFGKKGDK